ncbi:MAG: ABC transporter ATP-binding protein [Vicinamibacterales bacterium]|nr:ABC transporter ATP-binding protein [Vicinamibacterales bacterium]
MRLDLNTAAAVAARPVAAPTRVALEGVSLHYGRTAALSGVSLAVAEGEIVCLLGPSGSGKSTLLRLVAGIERPSEGRILIDGVEVAGPGRFVEPEARQVGMVFQDYALFPHLTIADNVRFGLRGRPPAEAGRIVAGLLERVGLARYAGQYPHTLSGGERQRVALARALAPAPRVLLMDEPFSSLDGRLRDQVREETLDLLRETATTTIFVTHDPDEAMRAADRIALLHEGRLVQCGEAEDLYTRPATLFAARFFSDINELPGTCRSGRVETPLGAFAAPALPEGAAASVCLRPEHVRLVAGPAGIAARVVRTAFLGEIDHVVVAVPGLDTRLTVRAFGRTGLDADDLVYLEVPARDALVVAHDGR